MNAFIISNTVSGATLGVYQAETAAEAYDAMAREAGYDNADDMHDATGSDGTEMQIDAMNASFAVHETFLDYSIGSAGFVQQIETVGGYDMSRTEIERIALAVNDLFPYPDVNDDDWIRAEKFHQMWRDESWWRDQQDNAPDTSAVRTAMLAGDADVLARHTIDGMTENYTLNSDVPAEAEQADIDRAVADGWSGYYTTVSYAVGIYCDNSVYGQDGQTLAPLSDDVLDAITARVSAWLTVTRTEA